MESEAEKELGIDSVADVSRAAAHTRLSLVRGGPFYRLLRAVGLIRPPQWNLGRRIAALLVDRVASDGHHHGDFESRRLALAAIRSSCVCATLRRHSGAHRR